MRTALICVLLKIEGLVASPRQWRINFLEKGMCVVRRQLDKDRASGMIEPRTVNNDDGIEGLRWGRSILLIGFLPIFILICIESWFSVEILLKANVLPVLSRIKFSQLPETLYVGQVPSDFHFGKRWWWQITIMFPSTCITRGKQHPAI